MTIDKLTPDQVARLVERLRRESQHQFPQRMRDGHSYHAVAFVLDQAATAITTLSTRVEALTQERDEAREALERIASAQVAFNAHPVGVIETMREWARAALNPIGVNSDGR